MGAKPWDTIIIGGGPAGLSAALVLGRCCRRVLVCDAGTPRSWAAHEMHGFLTRDGIAPTGFRALAHQQLERYDNVHFWEGEVSDVARDSENTFRVKPVDERSELTRKILIATGVMDPLPARLIEEGGDGRSIPIAAASVSAIGECAQTTGIRRDQRRDRSLAHGRSGGPRCAAYFEAHPAELLAAR